MDKIGVGIVTCDRVSMFNICFESLSDEWYDELVVVDDGEKEYPEKRRGAEFIRTDGRVGVGKAKNAAIQNLLDKDCDYIILAMGEGAISKNPDGKTKADIGVWNCFAHNLKVEFDNHPSGKRLNTHVYQSPNGFTDEEVMDIMKKHLDAKLGLSENIVTLSPIPLRGVLDV